MRRLTTPRAICDHPPTKNARVIFCLGRDAALVDAIVSIRPAPAPPCRIHLLRSIEIDSVLLAIGLAAMTRLAKRLKVVGIESQVRSYADRYLVVDFVRCDIATAIQAVDTQRMSMQVCCSQSIPSSIVPNAFATTDSTWSDDNG